MQAMLHLKPEAWLLDPAGMVNGHGDGEWGRFRFLKEFPACACRV